MNTGSFFYAYVVDVKKYKNNIISFPVALFVYIFAVPKLMKKYCTNLAIVSHSTYICGAATDMISKVRQSN